MKTAEIYTHTHTHTHTHTNKLLPGILVILGCVCTTMPVLADDGLDSALRATYTACVGIDNELADLKKMAGINTAITSVGAAAGVGATVTGFVKASKDKQAEELERLIQELAQMSDSNPESTAAQRQEFQAEFEKYYSVAKTELSDYKAQLEKLNKQSKNLGNWRTGLLAGGTATSIAGAAIAGLNKVDADLQSQINDCISAVSNLDNAILSARVAGADVTEATEIASACGEYKYVDVSKINNRGRGAMISSAVGAATGLTGTAVSGAANSNRVRDDNTDAGKAKEKNLNAAANVLSVGNTAASITATVFNATQIKAIKKVADVAEKCTGVLQ